MPVASELNINIASTAMQMAKAIFGNGVNVVSASYTGDPTSSGIYTNGDAISPGVVPSNSGVILSTGRALDFTNSFGSPNQQTYTSTNTIGPNNEAGFNALTGGSTFDASYLDVDFIPNASVLTMQFVFSSEEFPEFQGSPYQDAVGVWINGTHVPIQVGTGSINPDNLNGDSNQNLYLDNAGDTYNTEMDGFTLTLTLTIPVNPGVVNSIRIGIADAGDSSYDSNLLIAGDSLQTQLVAITDTASTNINATSTIDVLSNDIGSGSFTITHINGKAVLAGDTITLPTGQQVTLNTDGTLTFVNDDDTGTITFTYTLTDGSISDTGIVNVSSIPCFVAGTRVLTPDGEVPVEALVPGDLVLTRDDGPRPLRWTGSRTVRADGLLAPICIRAGAFGNHRDLLVSPQHRILLADALAELLFGEPEVLVAAQDMLNDRTVQRVPGGEVTYVHLMFDRHQVICSEGLMTESFLPGPQTASLFDRRIIEEICGIFPELDPLTGAGYGPAARRTLRRFEAGLLFNAGRAA